MCVLQGILSDGRTLLLLVAPAASPGINCAAAAAMAAGAAAALPASGIVMSARGKEGMLPWQAFHAMAYMVRESNMVKGPYQWHALPPLSADRWDHSAYVELCCHFHQQAALEAVCGATHAAQLLADNVLLSAWRAAASTLRLCSEVMQCTVLQDCAPRVQVSRQHTALSNRQCRCQRLMMITAVQCSG